MHPQLTYLLALAGTHDAKTERDGLRDVVSGSELAERRGRGRIVSLRASSPSRMTRLAAAELADQR
jgi:hypothetical protein